jgi:hypothetical protein
MRLRKLRRRKFTKYLIKRLKEEPIKKLEINDKWISFEYDDEEVSNEIIIKKHESYVGSWAKTKNRVYIDNNIKGKKDIKAIALHESIEKLVAQKYGLKEDTDAHRIATAKEKEFLKKIGGNWEKHQEKVNKVWRLEGEK